MLEWSEELELNIEIVDNQHKDIFEKINLLVDSFNDGTEQERAYEVLCFIEEYVNKHFKTEEFYLEKYNYKNLASHIQLHRDFSKQLEQYKINHRRSGITRSAAMEMDKFLTDWWYNHILKVDSHYASAIGEKIQ